MKAYTDGAFKYEKAVYAFVIIDDHDDNKIIYEEVGEADSAAAKLIWNIIGELEAVTRAIEWALRNDHKLELYFDLQGVKGWAEGWKTHNQWTRAYAEFMKNHKDAVTKFNWVKGHSGNKWNTYVDKLAYQELMRLTNG